MIGRNNKNKIMPIQNHRQDVWKPSFNTRVVYKDNLLKLLKANRLTICWGA
uniref:Uncharacterized protein n=1 Tax=Rhizophora mucronata TaxID=61149 RepID=A0A2P2PXE3_RHIMU